MLARLPSGGRGIENVRPRGIRGKKTLGSAAACGGEGRTDRRSDHDGVAGLPPPKLFGSARSSDSLASLTMDLGPSVASYGRNLLLFFHLEPILLSSLALFSFSSVRPCVQSTIGCPNPAPAARGR